MAAPWARPFYRSRAWRETREAYSAARFHVCERCGRPGEIVHHRRRLTPRTIDDPSVTVGWDNLELLCCPCHNREHTVKPAIRRPGFMFAADGTLCYEEPMPPMG